MKIPKACTSLNPLYRFICIKVNGLVTFICLRYAVITFVISESFSFYYKLRMYDDTNKHIKNTQQ